MSLFIGDPVDAHIEERYQPNIEFKQKSTGRKTQTMNVRRNYKILLDELEIMVSCVEPYHDSMIDLLPSLFDEIQENLPDGLFIQTSQLVEECRNLVAEYKRKGEDDARLVLESLLSSVGKIKRAIQEVSSTNEYNLISSGTVAARQEDPDRTNNRSLEDEWMDDLEALDLLVRKEVS